MIFTNTAPQQLVTFFFFFLIGKTLNLAVYLGRLRASHSVEIKKWRSKSAVWEYKREYSEQTLWSKIKYEKTEKAEN